MKYVVRIVPAARKQLARLPQAAQTRLDEHINSLADKPRPFGCKKLVGEGNRYRIRVGSYRILYSIRDDQLLVLVLKVGPRRDVYR